MPILRPENLISVAIIGITLALFPFLRGSDSDFAPLGNPPPVTRTASLPLSELPPLTMERVFPNLEFSRPTNLVSESGRLFVTEQSGQVREKSLLVDSSLRITSFGQDQQGALYALAEDCGIYKLTANR